MALLGIGDLAPDITAQRRDGSTLRLSSLRGRYVLVYFYPMDDTPGCTTESRGLNDSLEALSESGADVIGVSADSCESHQKFASKYGLELALAADRDHAIRKAYGVGRLLGLLPVAARVSFLIGPDGRVVHVWPHVQPGRHAADVLAEVRRRSRVSSAAG